MVVGAVDEVLVLLGSVVFEATPASLGSREETGGTGGGYRGLGEETCCERLVLVSGCAGLPRLSRLTSFQLDGLSRGAVAKVGSTEEGTAGFSYSYLILRKCQ